MKMMTAREIAVVMGVTRQVIQDRAARHAWQYIPIQGNGGWTKSYIIKKLPSDMQAAILRANSKNKGGSGVPDTLLVPPALEAIALAIVNNDRLEDGKANPYKGTATVVVSPRLTASAKGFRRAGRLWQGVMEIAASELTAAQIKELQAEPRLTVTEI